VLFIGTQFSILYTSPLISHGFSFIQLGGERAPDDDDVFYLLRGLLGSVRGLRGGGRRGWCEE
jgi:hypothetical protein